MNLSIKAAALSALLMSAAIVPVYAQTTVNCQVTNSCPDNSVNIGDNITEGTTGHTTSIGNHYAPDTANSSSNFEDNVIQGGNGGAANSNSSATGNLSNNDNRTNANANNSGTNTNSQTNGGGQGGDATGGRGGDATGGNVTGGNAATNSGDIDNRSNIGDVGNNSGNSRNDNENTQGQQQGQGQGQAQSSNNTNTLGQDVRSDNDNSNANTNTLGQDVRSNNDNDVRSNNDNDVRSNNDVNGRNEQGQSSENNVSSSAANKQGQKSNNQNTAKNNNNVGGQQQSASNQGVQNNTNVDARNTSTNYVAGDLDLSDAMSTAPCAKVRSGGFNVMNGSVVSGAVRIDTIDRDCRVNQRTVLIAGLAGGDAGLIYLAQIDPAACAVAEARGLVVCRDPKGANSNNQFPPRNNVAQNRETTRSLPPADAAPTVVKQICRIKEGTSRTVVTNWSDQMACARQLGL